MNKGKKIAIILISIFSLTVLLLTGIYFYGVFYFRHWFCPNTYINDVNVSCKNYNELDSVVNEMIKINDLVIIDNDGNRIVIDGDKIYGYDTEEIARAKEEIKSSENPYFWVNHLFSKHVYTYEPKLYLNENELFKILTDSSLAQKERFNEDNCAEIIYTKERGFELVDNTHDLLDWEMCKAVIIEAGENERGVIDLNEAGVYKSIEEDETYANVLAKWERLHKVIDFEMTYKLATGEDVVVDSSVISSFLVVDENNEVVFDENGEAQFDSGKILAFVQNMSDTYDNMYKDKKFKTTRGDVVSIPYSRYTTYGSLINVKSEAKELEDIVKSHVSPGEREPIYIKKEDKGTYANNYGGTYVEVDVTGQHMYYYKDNVLAFDTDVVTGCKSNGNMTPDCVCYIVNKARNITLIGPGYASFVYYWMCITGQIGIHDATWRRTFGGEIYLYGGSHGCVNTPIDKMKELFEMIEIGTPVIVHK